MMDQPFLVEGTNITPFFVNGTHLDSVCIPLNAFAKLQAASQASFGEATFWFIFAGIGIGVLSAFGILYVKNWLDERGG